jgi:hypothetical protein
VSPRGFLSTEFLNTEFLNTGGSRLLQATADGLFAKRVVTAVRSLHSIRYVPSRTVQMLTKRRAVDFCRVATAMCPRSVPFVA